MRPVLHLLDAASLPNWQETLIQRGVERARGADLPSVGRHLAAMAQPPIWVRALTHGRPDHLYAEGAEVELMHAALAERRAPLFYQGAGAIDRYRDALVARWARQASAGDLAPGALTWTAPPLLDRHLVPHDSYLACTCKPGQGCHLQWLVPWLQSAGWDVTLYGTRVA